MTLHWGMDFFEHEHEKTGKKKKTLTNGIALN
jgi:hypothetical protein